MLKVWNRPYFIGTFVFLLSITGCLLSISMGNYIAIILFLSLCGSLALFPNRNPLLYWPFGLALTVACLYGAYSIIWLFELGGLTDNRANFICLFLLTIFTVCWLLHQVLLRPDWTTEYHPVVSTFIVATVSSLLIYAVHRSVNAPELLIADHLAGGDHGIHIQYINGLVHGNTLGYSSPLSLESYPKGIHFLIALLFVIREANSQYSEIVNVHIVAGLFEYIQLAAFFQLMLLVIFKQQRIRLFTQVVSVVSLLVLFLSLPKAINHLFWSGFTTSLTLTWFLLLPLAFPWPVLSSRDEPPKWWRLVFWSAMSLLVWIVYQPYAIITVAFFVYEFISVLIKWHRNARVVDTNPSVLRLGVFVAPAITFLGPILILLVLGEESESIKRLSFFGVSWKVNQTLLLSTIAATLIIIGISRRFLKIRPKGGVDGLLYGTIISYTASFAIVAAVTSDFTLTNQPYYVQKMYWIVFFVGFVLCSKWVLHIVISMSTVKHQWLSRLLLVLLPISLLSPLVLTDISPDEAADRISIPWFAKGLFVDVSDIEPYHAAAFHTWENLGAHVGNIALMQTTSTFLPVDIAQSRNAYWACWTMRNSGVNVVYTAIGQGASLLDAGCNQLMTYIEDDQRIERLIPPTSPMVVNAEIPLRARRRGQRFLVAGFPQRDEMGAWAHGFHSTIQMVSTQRSDAASALFNVSEYGPIERSISIELVVDGVLIKTYSVEQNTRTIELSLPSIQKGSLISFQFVCQRNEIEIMDVLNDPELLKCLSLTSFEIRIPG